MSRAKSFKDYKVNEGKDIHILYQGTKIVNPFYDETGRFDSDVPHKSYDSDMAGTEMEKFVDNSELLLALADQYDIFYKQWKEGAPESENGTPDKMVLARFQKKNLVELKKAIDELIKLS